MTGLESDLELQIEAGDLQVEIDTDVGFAIQLNWADSSSHLTNECNPNVSYST